MKKILISVLVVMLGFGLLVKIAHAGPPCTDVAAVIQVKTSSLGQVDALLKVKSALTDYKRYLSAANDRYELCFDFNGEEPLFIPSDAEVLYFEPAADSDKDIVISGLELKQTGTLTKPLLTIEPNGVKNVFIDSLQVWNAKTVGLAIGVGAKVQVINSNFNQPRASDPPLPYPIPADSICIDIQGDTTRVKNSKISRCAEGIRIKASDVIIGAADANSYAADKNTITGNGIGIHVEKGNRNMFGFNQIYGNSLIEALFTHAIEINAGWNDDIHAPQLEMNVKDGQSYSLWCDTDSDGKLIKRYLKFQNLTGGTISLYSTDSDTHQAEEFFVSCPITADGVCDLPHLPSTVPILENECGVPVDIEYIATAIYTNDTNNSSSALVNPFPLRGPIVILAGGVITQTTDAPEATGDTGGGSAASGETSGAETRDTFVEEIGAGGGAMGMAAGCGGGGASMIPNDISSTMAPWLGLWWIITSIGAILYLRHQRARIPVSDPLRRRRK